MSVLVRSPSTVSGYFLKASRYVIGSPEGSPCQLSSFTPADLPTGPPRSRTDFQSSARLTCFVTPSYKSTVAQEYLTCFPSPTRLKPRLRVRLTQGRRTLPWKPWIFGEKDFHLLYRLLMPCIFTSMRSSTPSGIPSLHILRSPTACGISSTNP